MINRFNSYPSTKSKSSELARVMSYDETTGDLVCYTETGRQIHNPSYLSPYYSQTTTNGFFFIPSIADTLLIDYTVNNVPYVAGCTTPYGDFTQLGNSIGTITLNSGDYGFLISPSGSGSASGGLIFKNTGSILIQSNPFTSMLLVPSLNAMVANLHNIYLKTLLGSININEDEYGGVFSVNLQDVADATAAGNVYSFNILDSTGNNLYSTALTRSSGDYSVVTQSSFNVKSKKIIQNGTVLLGSDSASDPSVLGNELKTTLSDMKTVLTDLLNFLSQLPDMYSVDSTKFTLVATGVTAHVPIIQQDIAKVTSDIDTILSQTVSLV